MKTFALSFLLAVLGFSYALATHSDSAGGLSAGTRGVGVGNRDVGTPLRFTNPFLQMGSDPSFLQGGDTTTDPQGFDLGDANIGLPVVRYLNAAGGFLPYTFTTLPNFDMLGPDDVPPIPNLLLNGEISDTFDTPINGAARFDATVTDFLGNQRLGTYRLNLVPQGSDFRFAQDQLPTAQLGNDYFTNLATVNAASAVTFSTVGVINANGANSANNLQAFGLTLTPDGILYGRPSFPRTTGSSMTLQFVARATDADGNIALSRNGQTQDEFFTLTVEDNAQATSEIMATRCAITSNSQQETFTYIGAFDPKGLTLASFAGSPFTLRVGGAAISGSFDSKGKINQVLGPKSVLKVSISPATSSIQIQLQIAGANLIPPTTVPKGEKLVGYFAIMMEFKHYRACEALMFSGREVGTNVSFLYTSDMANGMSLAGGFQILSFVGQDQQYFDGTKGDPTVDADAWLVRWMGVPRFNIDSGAATAFPVRVPSQGAMQTGTVNVTIRLGDDTLTPVTATIASNRLRFPALSPTSQTPPTHLTGDIYELILDPKTFIHSVQTNALVESDTNYLQAIKSTDPTIFKFGMDITGYSGETGRVMAPNNSSWQER